MPEIGFPYVYRVTFKGHVLGEEALNMFYYAGEDAIVGVNALAVAVKEAVWNPLQVILSGDAQLNSVSVEGVKGDTIFGDVAIGEAGAIGGDCLPPYAAFGFELVRAGVGERNGYKRFAGVAETSQSNGIAASSVYANIPDILTGLAQTVLATAVDYVPVIRRTRVHKVAQNPPTFWSFGSAIFLGVTTQSSRKFGHGS